MTVFRTNTTIDNLGHLVGSVLGRTTPLQLNQSRIDTFAEATEDHQWIHTDPQRAAAGPFGTTIAHGYLTLSLIAGLASQTFEVTDASSIVNYGLDKVRFPSPVPADSCVSLELQLINFLEITGGVQLEVLATIHVVGREKPAVVATQLLRVYR